MTNSLGKAIETARNALDIQQNVTGRRDNPMAIVDQSGHLGVFKASAFWEPGEPGILPWSPPRGVIVGFVFTDGTYHSVEDIAEGGI